MSKVNNISDKLGFKNLSNYCTTKFKNLKSLKPKPIKTKYLIITVVIIAIIGFVAGSMLFTGVGNIRHNYNYSAVKTKSKQVLPGHAISQIGKAQLTEQEIAASMQETPSKDKALDKLLTQITSMQDTLAKSHIASNEQIKQLQAQLVQLGQKVADIGQKTIDAKLAAIKSEQLSQTNYQASKQQFPKVESQLRQIRRQLTRKKYLPASVLPFEVVGIDFWNNEPQATIAIRDIHGVMHYRLMARGSMFGCRSQRWKLHHCTNWELFKLTTSPNVVIFRNHRGQMVREEI